MAKSTTKRAVTSDVAKHQAMTTAEFSLLASLARAQFAKNVDPNLVETALQSLRAKKLAKIFLGIDAAPSKDSPLGKDYEEIRSLTR